MSYVSELDMVRTSADKVTAKPVTNKQRSKAARQTQQFKDKMVRNSVSIEWMLESCRYRHGQAMKKLEWASEATDDTREMYLGMYRGWVDLYAEMVARMKSGRPYQGSNVMKLPN